MTMPGRNYQAETQYRYGFNGKEVDLEVAGTTTYDYGFRIYNPAIGKFLSVDPLTKSYPFYTPYQFAGGKPIQCIDLDGLEEFDTYADYKKSYGANAMDEAKWDGSDGAWLESDRTNKSDRWKKAMKSITENNTPAKLADNSSPTKTENYGEKSVTTNTVQGQIGSSFAVIRDYYFWCQGQMDSKGYGESEWAKGAAYLVDELADTYEEGVTTGGFKKDLGKLLVELNVAIKDYAVGRFQKVLNGGNTPNSGSAQDCYFWDRDFIEYEQGTVAQTVYSKYDGTSALSDMNTIARKDGVTGNLLWVTRATKHYVPSFAQFDGLSNGMGGSEGDAVITRSANNFGSFFRINIPMFMLWPTRHQAGVGIKLSVSQNNNCVSAMQAIHKFYNDNKIK